MLRECKVSYYRWDNDEYDSKVMLIESVDDFWEKWERDEIDIKGEIDDFEWVDGI